MLGFVKHKDLAQAQGTHKFICRHTNSKDRAMSRGFPHNKIKPTHRKRSLFEVWRLISCCAATCEPAKPARFWKHFLDVTGHPMHHLNSDRGYSGTVYEAEDQLVQL